MTIIAKSDQYYNLKLKFILCAYADVPKVRQNTQEAERQIPYILP